MNSQIQCPHCGVLQENSLFCKDCGKLLNAKPSPQVEIQPQPGSSAAVLPYPDSFPVTSPTTPIDIDYHKGLNQDVERYLATRETRALNLILDTIFSYFFAFISVLTLAFMGLGDIVSGMNEQLLEIIIFFCYYVLFENSYQKTIGKFITKTKVVTENGEKPALRNILGRTLCRLIPFEVFSFLANPAVGWHDSISKTRVINDI